MFKIDIHTHILPKDIPNFKNKFGYGGFIQLDHHQPSCARMVRDDGKFFREVQSNCWDPIQRMQDCEKNDVKVQVLSTVPVMFGYWTKPNDGLDLSRYLNDHIAEIVSQHPKQFIGLGTIPMQDPDLAIQELTRCMKDLRLAGVQIGSNVNQENLSEKKFFPIFEAAEKMGAAIFVHPWEMMGQDKMEDYWLPWLVGMPAETSRAICSMIFSGLLQKLPRLRVAFAHGGGSFPMSLGRIVQGFESRPDLCAVDNPVNPREYTKRIYVDTLVHDPKVLQFAIDLLGVDRIAIGSDYPFPLGETKPGKIIESLGLSKRDQEWLYYKTAIQWLGTSNEKFL